MGGFVGSVVGSVTDAISDVADTAGDIVGGAVGTVGDVINGAVDAVGDLGKSVDNFVNDNIPGGWATVAIVAGAYYFGPELMAAEGAGASTSATAGVTATSEASALTGVEAMGAESAFATPEIVAATEGAGASAAAGTGMTMPTVANVEAMGGAQGMQASTAANLSGPSLTSPSTWIAPEGMGGAQGLTTTGGAVLGDTASYINAPEILAAAPTDLVTSAAGTAAVTEAGTAGTGFGTKEYFATKGALGELGGIKAPKQTTSGDNTMAMTALMGLLTKRRTESMGRRDTTTQAFSAGGDVKNMAIGGWIGDVVNSFRNTLSDTPSTTSNTATNTKATAPDLPDATLGNAVITEPTAAMQATAPVAGAATQATAPTAVTAATAAAPTTVAAPTITASTAQGAIEKQLEGVQAAQGQVKAQDLATAATQAPTTTAVSGLQAAQGQAAQVAPVADRTLQAGELVSGTAVDQSKVNAALAQNVAAQGTVTSEMTTQGQLNKILTDFDAGNPPPWASSSMRAATAQLAARGLGASSLAGQAIIQAALEAATPIAAADAKVYEQMGLTNLSNRQAMALTTAQQRAAFLGQEFDQNFQTKVLNAAKISDIADKNFTADVQVALENAQLANTMNLANLSNKQALTMATAAQMANLETTNLNNRQQVAVENAKAFLAMDMKNVDLQQQTTLFKAQDVSNAILSDTAAVNAAKATNAANALDADKVNAQLALTASQFNASERNKVALTNMATAADLIKFNAAESNDRAEFNANLSGQINMANAKILADISTANTREVNALTAVNAKNATDLSASTYAQLQQTYRDQLEMSWKTTDNDAQRANDITKTTITANATKYSAEQNADAQFYAAVGNAVAKIGTSGGGETLIDWITKKVIG